MAYNSTSWTNDNRTKSSGSDSEDMTVKNIIEQIEGIFGRQPQAYIFRLINDGLNEISAKCKSYKTSRTTDLEKHKRWYDLHNSVIDITKVEIKDSDGRYVRIPKLVDSHKLLKDDTESSESILK